MSATSDAVDALLSEIATFALRYPEATEGVACAGTAIESRTVRTGKRAFVFLRRKEVRQSPSFPQLLEVATPGSFLFFGEVHPRPRPLDHAQHEAALGQRPMETPVDQHRVPVRGRLQRRAPGGHAVREPGIVLRGASPSTSAWRRPCARPMRTSSTRARGSSAAPLFILALLGLATRHRRR